LSGAIAASKIHVPIIHIEAGLRSFNKAMPEEVNRIMCDHVSTLLFSPTKTGYQNLLNEGFKSKNEKPFNANNPKIYHSGDVMFDNSLYFSEVADEKTTIISKNGLQKNNFILATIHRNNNTDEPVRLNSLFNALFKISEANQLDVLLPLHPRTAKLLEFNLDAELHQKIKSSKHFKIIAPVSFLEMIALEKNCKIVMTDSGGVQKEAFYFEKPCVILRPETEWVELVECGTAIITDANEQKIIEAYKTLTSKTNLQFPKLYGDGKAAEFICGELLDNLK
jgi:UDP-GlcNAc3NAcA epimerase